MKSVRWQTMRPRLTLQLVQKIGQPTANRFGRDELAFLGLHESPATFVNLPEARALGQTIGADPLQVFVANIAEKRRICLV